MSVKVGSFAKSTSGAPASQSVTGVGFKPAALILWTVGKTATGVSTSFLFSVGFSADGDSITSGSAAVAAQEADPSNTSMASAAKALTICQWGESTVAECDLSSFDADGFTLNWTTNDATAILVNYMALKGCSHAKVVNWTTPTSNIAKAVTGVGFQPDCVLHLHSWATSPAAGGVFGIGAMTTSDQWAAGFNSGDNYGNENEQRCMYTDRTIATVDNAEALAMSAAYTSMDADGFTTTFSTSNASAQQVYSLALKGGNYKLGSFTKPNAALPEDQAITGAGFRPAGVFFTGNNWTSTGIRFDLNFSVGAGDGGSNIYAGLAGTSNSGTPTPRGGDYEIYAVSEIAGGANWEVYGGTLKSLDADGFTISWDVPDSNQDIFLYLALLSTSGGNAPLAMHYKRLRTA